MMLKLILFLLLSINLLYSQGLDKGLNQMVSQISESMPSSAKQKIAIIEFSDLDGKVTELGKFLSEELITKLFMTKKFNVVERQLLNKILQEHQINMSGIVDENTIKQLGKILGVDAICTGTITDLGEQVKINGRLISTETGSVFSVAYAMIDKDATITRLMSKTSNKQNSFRNVAKHDKPGDNSVEGLLGEYYNIPPFKNGELPTIPNGAPTTTRIDETIQFDWYGNPAQNISKDYFYIKWTGFIYAEITGTYVIYIKDGCYSGWGNPGPYAGYKVSINEKKISKWKFDPHSKRSTSRGKFELFLEAGKWYPVKIEIYDREGSASVALCWYTPGSNKLEPIPSTNLRTNPKAQ